MRPAVLMVGGGVQQVEAVRVARAAGFRVFVSDRDPHAPAFAEADERWIIDGVDRSELARRALEAKERGLAGAFTLTELVETVADVAAAAGLPGVRPDAARACQDKGIAKERWLAAGVATPHGGTAHDLDGARALFRELGGRAFVKPTRGFGGRGGSRVEREADLELAFHLASEAFSAPGSLAQAHAPRVLIEELLDGTHHDANGIFDRDGRFHSAGVCDRRFHPTTGMEWEGHAPSELAAGEQRAVLDLTERAARALGIDFGPVKSDLVRTSTGFRVLEIAPRLHGPKGTLFLIPLALGYQPLAAALRVLTGVGLASDDLVPKLDPLRRSALFRALDAAGDELWDAKRIEAALALPGVEQVTVLRPAGAKKATARRAATLDGYVLTTGRDPAEARARAEAASALLDLGDHGAGSGRVPPR